jgi:hypothetical protein
MTTAVPMIPTGERMAPRRWLGPRRPSRPWRTVASDGKPAACRERLDEDAARARRVVEAFGRACRTDVDQFCSDVDPGGGRVIGCLGRPQPESSSSCQTEIRRLAQAREQVSAFQAAWYQATLSQAAATELYKYGVGMCLAYFFDW